MKKVALTVLLLSALILAGARAQEPEPDPTEIAEQVDETVELEKDTQSSLNDWSEERQALEVRYKTAKANIAFIQERLARRNERAAALDAKVAELERRLTESARLNEVIQDTLNVILSRLESEVETDLPFLFEEREARLANLRHAMAAPDLDPAEKLRVLLEALLVEAQDGETVEVQAATIPVGAQNIHVDVLRIGRLALYWRSPDGSRVGTWDPVDGAWTELPGKYNRVISRSMEMASRMRPTELVSLPLGRITR
jgi:predicted nuclease with TOPRIM domain